MNSTGLLGQAFTDISFKSALWSPSSCSQITFRQQQSIATAGLGTTPIFIVLSKQSMESARKNLSAYRKTWNNPCKWEGRRLHHQRRPSCVFRYSANRLSRACYIRENARRFEAGEPLLNLLKPNDAVTASESKGGWSRLMNANLTREQAEKLDLEKYLGKRGWSDPSEWM